MHVNSSSPQVYRNLTPDQLIEQAILRKEGILAQDPAGVLAVATGARTGRSPKDKFIVQDDQTEKTIAWGAINQPITEATFNALWQRAEDYLHQVDRFESHLQVAASAVHYLPLKVMTEYAWHQLFVHQLFIRPKDFYGRGEKPEWTLMSAPGLATDPKRDTGVQSDATLIIHFSKRKVLLCGHRYAGEMKKAMFSVLNYLLPEADVLPMHCAANVGKSGDVALFFGLSGTGKTTLSADITRQLIGDDEHGWDREGVFNFEGGCYAKCINLSAAQEPVIWHAIRKGTVMENVVLNPQTLTPEYENACLTQNTRAAYPRDFIENRVLANRVDVQPRILIFLTCDLYGVLPPIARLTKEQAIYYFLSGYTALVGSTEVGQTEAIKATFSTCFGAPFFPRPANVYAALLEKRLQESHATVYLVNTGWYGGAYGEGKRFPLLFTRQLVHTALSGILDTLPYQELPKFRLAVPKTIPEIDGELLDPRLSWNSQQAYEVQAKALIQQFNLNFKKFSVDERIHAAGPSLVE
jgi:phosphoenolpyruvate carboxykinase (ATP)